MKKHEFEPTRLMKKNNTYREVKIKCMYCDLKDTCHLRARKESYEKSGWVTKCPFTPNGNKKHQE